MICTRFPTLHRASKCIAFAQKKGVFNMVGEVQPKQFLAIHGVGHGAWVYYKVKPRMEALGYKFSPISLAAAGNSPKKLEEVRSLHDYTTPLLEALAAVPEGEKAVLIGHSGGGYAAAYAMEQYPEKIAVAVFLNALMPDTKNRPSFVIDEVYYIESSIFTSIMDTFLFFFNFYWYQQRDTNLIEHWIL